jgi:hypothetical protein
LGYLNQTKGAIQMTDKVYQIAMILSVSGDSYEEALDRAEKFNMQLANTNSEFDDCDIELVVEHNYEHDNQGQRVLYLHSEEEPICDFDDDDDLPGLDRMNEEDK